MVINCALTKELNYREAEVDFHHLRDEGQGQIYGLKFTRKEDAYVFVGAVKNAFGKLSCGFPGMSLDTFRFLYEWTVTGRFDTNSTCIETSGNRMKRIFEQKRLFSQSTIGEKISLVRPHQSVVRKSLAIVTQNNYSQTCIKRTPSGPLLNTGCPLKTGSLEFVSS